MPRENKSKIKQTVTMTSAMAFSKQSSPARATATSPVVVSKPIQQEAIIIESIESKAPTVKDIVRLRYMRFRSNDIEATIDFYTTIGMNLEFKSDQMPWINPNAPKKRNTTNQTQGKSKVTEVKEIVQIPKPTKKAVVSFSFKAPGSTSVDPNENIQLIFEKADTLAIVTSEKNDQPIEEKDVKTLLVKEEAKEPHSYEYLVIYVRFLDRIVKRMEAKGYKRQNYVSDQVGIKMAIMNDPNGIQVRLMELIDHYLGENDNSKKTWFARLGYYTVPTTNTEDSIDFYEDTLSVFKQKQAPDEMQAILGIAAPKKKKIRILNRNTDSVHAKMQLCQFRLVDCEEYVIGLTQTSFYWMANDTRTSACSICFSERSDVDAKFDSNQSSKKNDLKIISIGFHVSNLDASVSRIKSESKGLIWEEHRYLINKVGLIARFLDRSNNIWVELLTGKLPDPPKTKERGRTLQNDETFYSKKESTSAFYINKNHLKGRVRSLSEGAAERKNSYLEDDEYLSPYRNETDSKTMVKSPSCKF